MRKRKYATRIETTKIDDFCQTDGPKGPLNNGYIGATAGLIMGRVRLLYQTATAVRGEFPDFLLSETGPAPFHFHE